jgi:hypothetical protein
MQERQAALVAPRPLVSPTAITQAPACGATRGEWVEQCSRQS